MKAKSVTSKHDKGHDPLGHRCRNAASLSLRYARGAESLRLDGGSHTERYQELRDKAVHYAQIAEGTSTAAGGFTVMIRELYLNEPCAPAEEPVSRKRNRKAVAI